MNQEVLSITCYVLRILKKGFSMKSILTLFTIHYSLFTFLQAGFTDFKTINEAKEAYEAKEYTKSAALLNDLDLKSPEKEYDIGNAYYKSKNYDAAIKSYKKAKGVDKATRLHNMGNSYFLKKDLDSAIKSYEESLKIKEDEETRFNLELAKKMKKKQEKQKKKDKQQKKDQDKKKDQKKQQDQNSQNKQQKDDQQKKDDQKKKDQQKKDKKDQNKQDQKKKKDQQKKDKDGQKKEKKKENEKKEGDKKKSDSPKEKEPKDKKGDKASGVPKEQKKMSKEDKIKQQELKRLLKKMQQKGTPTMMYQMSNDKKSKRSDGANPW